VLKVVFILTSLWHSISGAKSGDTPPFKGHGCSENEKVSLRGSFKSDAGNFNTSHQTMQKMVSAWVTATSPLKHTAEMRLFTFTLKVLCFWTGRTHDRVMQNATGQCKMICVNSSVLVASSIINKQGKLSPGEIPDLGLGASEMNNWQKIIWQNNKKIQKVKREGIIIRIQGPVRTSISMVSTSYSGGTPKVLMDLMEKRNYTLEVQFETGDHDVKHLPRLHHLLMVSEAFVERKVWRTGSPLIMVPVGEIRHSDAISLMYLENDRWTTTMKASLDWFYS